VGGGDGSVSFYRNVGSKEEPRLSEPEVLLSPSSWDGDGSRPGVRTKVCVTDWNEDGRPDLLVGDFASVRESEPELTDEQKAEREQAKKEYEDAMKEYRDAMQNSGLSKIYEEYAALQNAPEDESAEAAAEREKKAEELLNQVKELQEKEMKPFIEKLSTLSSKLPNRQSYHGFVWLFLRESIGEPAAGN
jgi:hypothetical protein